MKKCTKCGETKPLGDFFSYRSQCRVCFNIYKRNYYSKNKDVLKEKVETKRKYKKTEGKKAVYIYDPNAKYERRYSLGY